MVLYFYVLSSFLIILSHWLYPAEFEAWVNTRWLRIHSNKTRNHAGKNGEITRKCVWDHLCSFIQRHDSCIFPHGLWDFHMVVPEQRAGVCKMAFLQTHKMKRAISFIRRRSSASPSVDMPVSLWTGQC